MPTSSTPETWVVAGRAAALQQLAPLIQAYRAVRPVRVVTVAETEFPTVEVLGGEWDDAASLLVIGERRRSPRNVVPGLFLKDQSGRRVPIGWLPDAKDRLRTFAEAAARVVTRSHAGAARGPLVLLGQWEDRTLRLTGQTEQCFQSTETDRPLPLFRWTSERIARTDMLAGLRCGVGIAIYFGHGRARGWAGYHGVRGHHLPGTTGEPVGAVLSLTCHVASRYKVGLSFAEEMVLGGFCAASLGATSATVHLENGLLAHKICATLANRDVATVGELLVRSGLTERECTLTYRLVGDPLASLAGEVDSCARAAEVYAPAPDDPLPPLPDYETELAEA
jgi:hypothetical protein